MRKTLLFTDLICPKSESKIPNGDDMQINNFTEVKQRSVMTDDVN